MTSLFDSVMRDLRFSLRSLRGSLGLTSAVVATLALCIGANTAIFSMVYGLMLKPLPYTHPERIVEIYNTYRKAGLNKAPSSIVQYVDYAAHATSYEAIGLWSHYQGLLGSDANTQRLNGARATADFFEVLGIKPLIGSFFTLENNRTGNEGVLVITQSYWESHFQEDPAVLGKTVRLDGETMTIIGVAPRSIEAFDARVRFIRPVAWAADRVNPAARHSLSIQFFGRLKPGVSAEQAEAEAILIEKRAYDEAAPSGRTFSDRAGHKIEVGGVQQERVAPSRMTLLLLQGGVLFVLLIGCVNVANLLLVRANGRQTELAIRFALGASRGHVAGLLWLEAFVLTALGASLGILFGWGALQAINPYTARMLPGTLPFVLDGSVLLVTLATTALVGVGVGFVPVIHLLRTNVAALIQASSRGASAGRGVRTLSSLLVIGQVAVALILLTGAGLLIHSFAKALSVDPGFNPSQLISGRIVLPLAQRSTDEVALAFRQRLETSLREIPGVSGVTLSIATPFLGSLPINALTLAEDNLPPGSAQPSANRVIVAPSYLETMQLRLKEGRFFEPSDLTSGRPVFVVDEAFAKRMFPNRSALNGRFVFGPIPTDEKGWPVVVGVVSNVPHNGVEDKSGVPFVYQLLQGRPTSMTVFLRTTRPEQEAITLLRRKLGEIDPAIPLFDVGTMQSFVDSSFNNRRAVMLLLGGFAVLALFLSALGIYGVLAYDVAQRTREIGIRGAIGATRGQLMGMILKQGLLKSGVGLLIGVLGAFALSETMRSLLFELEPTDPVSFFGVSLVLLIVSAIASWIPARRAARVDPVVALRSE